MECPPRMVDTEDDYILVLNKGIYGLVQAATQYHEKNIECLHKIECNCAYIDPCLFWKYHEKGFIFVVMYVENN